MSTKANQHEEKSDLRQQACADFPILSLTLARAHAHDRNRYYLAHARNGFG
jgi:hypothetical protein